MVHYYPLAWSKINQQVIKKERKRKAPVHKVLSLYTSHMPKLSPQVSWQFPVPGSVTSSVLGLGQLGQPNVAYCNIAQMIYEVKLAQEAPVWPQQYLHLCFRPGETETRFLPAISATAGPGKASAAHKSLHQGRGLYQGSPFVSSVSDSHDSAIKAEILLTSTVIYYREKSGSRFDTNLTVITSTQLCAEEAWSSYPTGEEGRVAYSVFLLFLICHCPPHCLPSSLRFYIYSFWQFSFL